MDMVRWVNNIKINIGVSAVGCY